MTARATFPHAAVPPDVPLPSVHPVEPPAPVAAEAQLAAAVLRLWQARADPVARLCAAFGPREGGSVIAALDRLWLALERPVRRDAPWEGSGTPDPVALALLVDTTLQGPEAEERARLMALGLVPAHRMPALVAAARGLGLALRRAVLLSSPRSVAGCPASGTAA